MTREEAKAIIRKEYLCVDRDCDIDKSCGRCDLVMPDKEPILEAYRMAIQALSFDDTKYHEEHGEVVIADVVWEDAKQALEIISKGQCSKCEKWDKVLQEPSAGKTGRWVEIDEEPHEVWECDHCGFVIDGSGCIEPTEYRDGYKYCPNCGTKMIEEGEQA